MEQILRSCKHLLRIVNDIIDLSKMDHGHLQLEKRAFARHHVLSDVMDMLAPKAPRKGLALQVHIHDEVSDHWMGGPQRITQILIGHVQNTIKLTPMGEVVMSLWVDSQDAQGLVLNRKVRCSGMGHIQSQMTQLFQPFHQPNPSITRRLGGTGLGLVISSQLAELIEASRACAAREARGALSGSLPACSAGPSRLPCPPTRPRYRQRHWCCPPPRHTAC